MRILDIEHDEYGLVWRAWKGLSLVLFAGFVAVLCDIARTLRRIQHSTGGDR